MSERLRRQCEGKIPHETQVAAVAHKVSLKKQGAARMHAYKCKRCKKWHVGHLPRPRSS